jgi:hypothetical protein
LRGQKKKAREREREREEKRRRGFKQNKIETTA